LIRILIGNNIKDNTELIVMFGGLPLKNAQVTLGELVNTQQKNISKNVHIKV